MALTNLPEKFLSSKLPAGIVQEDVKGLVQAFVDGLQDRQGDLRALAAQLSQIWTSDSNTGELAQVVEFTYQIDGSAAQTAILDVQPSTPNTGAALLFWAEAQAGVESGSGISAVRTTSLLRTTDSNLLDLLASTVGARLSAPVDATDVERLESFKRILRGYFSRLKIKGTAASFEIAGRLQGFSDVRFTPLWGRVSPRLPNAVGSTANDADFAGAPDVVVTPGQPSELYDIEKLDDGEAYVWQSSGLTANATLASYLPLAVNGSNPFVNVKVVGAVALPNPGVYVLSGGASLTKAKSAASATAGFYFEAIAPGASFNGLKVEVSVAGAGAISLRVAHSLSAIKFRSSYFDLTACFSLTQHLAKHAVLARANPDLAATPNLHRDASGLLFSHGGIAFEHARPWAGPTPRNQASASTEMVDLDFIQSSAKQLLAAVDEVRPMTRFARKIRYGLSFEHQVAYANYVSRTMLVNGATAPGAIGAGDTIEAEIEAPSGLFVGTFELTAGGVSYPITAEVDETDQNKVNLIALAKNAGGVTILAVTGVVHYDSRRYSIALTTAPGPVVLTGIWTPVSTELVRANVPTQPDRPASQYVYGYQDRPEDELDLTYALTLESHYPWRRGLLAGGEQTVQDDPDAFDTKPVAGIAMLLDECQEPLEVTAVDTGKLRPYVVSKMATSAGLRAVGFYGDPLTADSYYPRAGSLPSVERSTGVPGTSLAAPFGVPYEIGLVRGQLVATPSAHWLPAQAEALALWLPLSEHAKQPYPVKDLSNFGLTQAELEAGGYSASYLLADRVEDDNFGWVLALQAGRGLAVSKDRGLKLDFALAAWLKPGSTAGGGSTVLEFGPVHWTLAAGGVLRVKYSSKGNLALLPGSASILSGFNFIAVSGASLQPTAVVEADAGSASQTAVFGLGSAGGQQLLSGQLVLLTGQTSVADNGLWVAQITSWVRATLPAGFDPQGGNSYFKVKNGSTAGLWKLTAPNAYLQVNCRLSVYSGTLSAAATLLASTDVLLDSFESAGSDLALAGPSWEVQWSNIRAWAKAKTAAELNIIRKPAIKPLALVSRPSSIASVSGDRYCFDVLPSGLARPSLKARSSSQSSFVRVSRYTGKAPKPDKAHRQTLGFGEFSAPEASSKLGAVSVGLHASGLTVTGTSTEFTPGLAVRAGAYVDLSADLALLAVDFDRLFTHPVDAALYARSELGHLIRLTPVINPGSAPAPITLEAVRVQEPARLNFSIGAFADRPAASPGLVDHFYYSTELSRALTPISKCDGVSWLEDASLTKRQVEELAVRQDYGETAKLVNSTTLAVTVITTPDGVLEARTQSRILPAASPTRYLYCHASRKLDLDFSKSADFSLWDYAADGVDVASPIVTGIKLPARESSGLLTFKGTGTLPVGRYRVSVDASNWGVPDPGFSGFALEASLGQNAVAEFKALTAGQPKFSLRYSDAGICGSLPANVDRAELQAAVGSSLLGVLDETSYASRRGGPYYVRFNAEGVRTLLEAVTTGCTFKATRLVAGTSSVKEIQKLELFRPVSTAEITVTEAVTVGGDGFWRLQLYWRNDLPASNERLNRSVRNGAVVESVQRTILIHSARLEQLKTQIVSVQVGSAGSAPALAVVDISSRATALPGGWQAAISATGARSLAHEAELYTSGAAAPIAGGPSLPAAALLTGSSAHRFDSVVLYGSIAPLGDEFAAPAAPGGNLILT